MLECITTRYIAVRRYLRPGRVLGLLLFGFLVGITTFSYWAHSGRVLFGYTAYHPSSSTEWVAIYTATAAICGWLVSSIVTIRNSIKQHTVNTLLQTRLSATYMERATRINRLGMERLSTILQHENWRNIASNQEVAHDLPYILNYMEFVAVGIRHGDLDETMMKMSLRGIAISLHTTARPYLERLAKDDPRSLEHFRWLAKRWAQ